ncbi:MAG: hypothetical protein GY715_11980, partial [Planctomycetes bacterium]|nr:hypothetical protein [Planctomycetota bacterium]
MTVPETAPAARVPVPGLDEAERLVLDATNAQRAKLGLSPLAPEPTLRQVARA